VQARGLGTSAFFSDQETFDNSSLVAGELDLGVGYTAHYPDWSDDDDGSTTPTSDDDASVRICDGPAGATGDADALADTETGLPANDAWVIAVDDPEQFLANTRTEAYPDGDGTVDAVSCTDTSQADDAPKPVVNIDDAKPDDFGLVSFELVPCNNPGYVWLDAARRMPSEGGTTEPEVDDPDEIANAVELLDVARAAIRVDNGDETLLETGTLREVLMTDPAADSGTFLNASANDAAVDGGGAGSRACFAAETTSSGRIRSFRWSSTGKRSFANSSGRLGVTIPGLGPSTSRSKSTAT